MEEIDEYEEGLMKDSVPLLKYIIFSMMTLLSEDLISSVYIK